jgi:hypothetical protein
MTGEDWRLVVELDDEANATSLGERLRALELGHDARRRLGSWAVVSRSQDTVFVYTRTRVGPRRQSASCASYSQQIA